MARYESLIIQYATNVLGTMSGRFLTKKEGTRWKRYHEKGKKSSIFLTCLFFKTNLVFCFCS